MSKHISKIFLISFLLLAVFGVDASVNANGSNDYQLPQLNNEISVDGELSQGEWQGALKIELNYETAPGENTEPPVKTEVYLFEDGQTLYVAFNALDPNPEEIRNYLTDRDNLWDSDFVGIKLDTFGEARRLYQFFSNPSGVQGDATEQANTRGRGDNSSWDGIWHNAAKVNASGYVVEMAIPFSTLRFPASEGGQPRKWKFELLRFLPRSVKHRIANTPVDRNNPCKFCQFDSLVGFTDLQASTNLQITPTLVLDKIDTRPDPVIDNWQSHDTASSAGLDIRWGITQDSVLNATINPDFSQVEADDVELDINNPYSIRYQEKRPFFTEGEEYFSTHNPLVHTRDMIEPDYGLKLTGQNNGHSYGVFFVKDKHTSFLIPGNLGSKLVVQENVESENQVVRYSRDLGNKNNIGFLVTDRQGEDYSNQVKSVDTVYWLGQNNSLTFQYMVSDSVYSDVVLAEYIEPNRNPATYDYVKEKYLSDDAYILRFMHDSRNWVGYFFNGRTGKDFRADLGFKDKADYDKKVIGFGRRFYSESKDSWLSDFYLGADWDLAVDIDGRELERESEIKFRAKGLYQSTYDAELKSRETYYDGDVSDGIDGEYFNENSFTLRVGFEPVQGINVNFRAEIKDAIDYANFRQGESVNNSIQFKWQIGQGLNTQIDFKDVDFDVAQGHLFDAQATNVKLTYHFNVKSFMRLTMQNLSIHKNQSLYIDPVDSKYESKGNQFLYSYRVNPQTLIYAGYSDVGYQDDQLTQFARTGKRLFMKFSYAWNA